MLYECYRCGNPVDENEGMIIHKPTYSIFLSVMNMVFVCKNCLSKKGREKFDKAKKI